MRRLISISCITALILSVSCRPIKKADSAEYPNIIFLMDDQHRWDALGIVNPIVHTPILDELAKDGVFFDQAVCQAPMCIASRYSMMLGLYPNQVGIMRNEPGLPDGSLPAKTLMELFREAGYETAGFGKAHWSVDCSTRGFETRYVGECFEIGAIMMKDLDPDKKARYDREVKDYGGGEESIEGYLGRTSGIPEGDHRDGWVLNKCLDYISTRDDARPLFLYLSFLKPHAGHNVPEGFEDHYDLEEIRYAQQPPWEEDQSPHASGINRHELYEGYWKTASEEDWRQMTMRYYANCTWIDDMYGRTLAALKEKGLLDNALIIYLSDHGEMLGERFYRFNKYCLYESSVRVPVILSGTALQEEWKGISDHRPVELVDVYPTLLKAAGIEIPETVVGMDLLSREKVRNASFCALHERPDEAAFMWREAGLKLILRFQRKADISEYKNLDIIGGELYDLKNDPQERVDLYNEERFHDDQRRMSRELISHLEQLKRLSPQQP